MVWPCDSDFDLERLQADLEERTGTFWSYDQIKAELCDILESGEEVDLLDLIEDGLKDIDNLMAELKGLPLDEPPPR